MDMDGGNVGTGATPWFPGGGGNLRPPVDDKLVHTTKAASSTRYIMGSGGFVRNGTTPSPSEAASFAAAALAASFRPIPAGGINHGGHQEGNDLQQYQTHAVYAYPSASTNWGSGGRSRNYDYGICDHGQRVHQEPCLGQRFEDNREGRAETAGRDGGSAGAGDNSDGISTKRQARMYALDLELLERAQNPKRMRSTVATSLPVTHGMVFLPSPRDPMHLRQDSHTAVCQRHRGTSAQQGQTFLPAKHSEEQYHHPDRKAPFGMCQERPCGGALGVVGRTIPRTEKRNVGNRCQHPGCTRAPRFGPRGGAKVYCVSHKHEGMVKVTPRQCAQDVCSTAPSYGFQGKRASFCSKHKMPGMVNVVTPRCQKDGCTSCASFGHILDRRPLFCARHAHDGMSNVVSRKCLGAGCTKNPSYGHPGDRRASFCVNHYMSGMANIVSPKCRAPGCGTVPSFGENGDRKASWCKSHKQGGMVNVLYSRQIKKEG